MSVKLVLSFRSATIVVTPTSPIFISNFVNPAFAGKVIFSGTDAICGLSEVKVTSTSKSDVIGIPFLFTI